MALNIAAASYIYPKPSFTPNFFLTNHHRTHFLFNFCNSSSANRISSNSFKVAAQSEGFGGEVTEEEPPGFTEPPSSARSQLDLLEQLTSTSSSTDGYLSEGESDKPTIRDQLYQMFGNRGSEEFTVPLGKNLKKVSVNFLTVSQKRNIRRQTYLTSVSERNDANFFTTIAAFVILPPILILGVAILTGYVQLFP